MSYKQNQIWQDKPQLSQHTAKVEDDSLKIQQNRSRTATAAAAESRGRQRVILENRAAGDFPAIIDVCVDVAGIH